jgi:hypothetical protein
MARKFVQRPRERVVEANHEIDAKPDQYITVPCSQARKGFDSVFANPQFQYSGHKAKFLHFVSDELFSECGSSLKAYCIADDGFDRQPSIGALTDPLSRSMQPRSHRLVRAIVNWMGCIERQHLLPKERYVPVFPVMNHETTEWCGSANDILSPKERMRRSGRFSGKR